MGSSDSSLDGNGYKASHTLRRWYLFFGAILVVAMLFATDPDGGLVQHLPFGSTTVAWLILVLRGLLVCTLAHITICSFFSWNPAADLVTLVRNAAVTPTGAGLALIAIAIILFGVLSVFSVK